MTTNIDLSAGFEAQLLHISSVQLYLLYADQSFPFKHGDFVLRLFKQNLSPLAAVLASVDDIYWPIGKDSPSLKLKDRSFTFAFPGLIYGLVLPETAPVDSRNQLEALLRQYSTFEIHEELMLGASTDQGKSSLSLWTTLAPEIMRLSKELPRGISSSPVASTIIRSVRNPNKGTSSHEVGALDPNPRSMKRIQRARRVSAISKLLSRTLVRGALCAKEHVTGMCVTQMVSLTKAKGFTDVAFAGVDAIAKVVEAVEFAGKGIHSNHVREKKDMMKLADDPGGSKGFKLGIASTSWTLNRIGLALLFHVIAASAKIHSSGNPCQSSSMNEPSFSTHEYCNPQKSSSPVDARFETYHENVLSNHPSSSIAHSFLPQLSLSSNPGYYSPPHAAQIFTPVSSSQAPSQQQPPTKSKGLTPFLPASP